MLRRRSKSFDVGSHEPLPPHLSLYDININKLPSMEVPPFPSNLLNTSSRLLTDTLSSPPKRPNFERSESCNSFRHNADSHSDNCSSGIFNPDFSFKSKDIDDQFSNIEGLGIDRNNSSTSSISVYSSDASSSENEASESESDPKSSTNPFNDINQVNNFLTVRNDSLVDETFTVLEALTLRLIHSTIPVRLLGFKI